MPRTLSEAIKNVLAQDSGETHDLVELTLPASGAEPEITLYCASIEDLTIDSQVYEPILRSVSQIKFSLGGNSDTATIGLENVSLELGQTVINTDRTLDGAKVVIKRAFRIEDGSFETMILFNGVVHATTVDQNLVTLTVVSDFTQRTAQVASRQLTQRCLWEFNVNGDGRSPECGWRMAEAGNPPDQVGDPLTCDLVYDSEGGCAGHANQHRFGGVPALISNVSTTTTGETIPGGGPGPGGYEDDYGNRNRWRFDIDANIVN